MVQRVESSRDSTRRVSFDGRLPGSHLEIHRLLQPHDGQALRGSTIECVKLTNLLALIAGGFSRVIKDDRQKNLPDQSNGRRGWPQVRLASVLHQSIQDPGLMAVPLLMQNQCWTFWPVVRAISIHSFDLEWISGNSPNHQNQPVSESVGRNQSISFGFGRVAVHVPSLRRVECAASHLHS